MPVYHSVSRVHLFLTRRTLCRRRHCEYFADLRFQLLTAANVSRKDEPHHSFPAQMQYIAAQLLQFILSFDMT